MPTTNPIVKNRKFQYRYRATNNGVVTSSYTSDYDFEVYRRTYSSVNTPGYKTKSKYELPWNSYQMTIIEEDRGIYQRNLSTHSYTQYYQNGSGTTYFSSLTTVSETAPAHWYIGTPSLEYANIGVLIGQASLKALLNLKDQKVNLGQVYAERQQVVKMINSSVKRIATSFSRLRRFDVLGAASALNFDLHPKKKRRLKNRADHYQKSGRDGFDFASDTWLEFVYGWKPLLSDIHGGLEKWVDYQSGKLPIIRVSGTSSEKVDGKYVKISETSTQKIIEIRNMTTKVKVLYEFSIDNQAFQSFSSFGLTNPLLLAWELLPFSFVVDWFVPVGNFLSALDARFGTTYRRGLASYTEDANSIRVGTEKSQPAIFYRDPSRSEGYVPTNKSGGENRYRRFVFTRALLLTPVLNVPSIKDPFSVSHVASAFALLQQAFRR